MRNKILIFGDSIVYGQRDLVLGGWTNRLKLDLANDSSIASCHVFNMGISGQTAGEVLARIDRECEGRVLPDANNIIILACGINDTQVIGGKVRTGEDEFAGNVRELIRHAKRHAPTVIYLGLTPVEESRTNPVWWDRAKCWNNDLIARYDGIIADVCGIEDIPYVHVYDSVDASGNDDGLHPSAEGHRVITEKIKEEIYGYLKRETILKAAARPDSGGFFKKALKILRKRDRA